MYFIVKLVLLAFAYSSGAASSAIVPAQCLLKAERGPCKALTKRWFFDGKICRKFDYGGCLGNKNNFASEFDCKNVCRQLPSVCYLPVKPGPCRGSFSRWYFDGKKCSKFIYGGCEGNSNNFETLAKCKNVCVNPTLPNRCYLPKQVGMCLAYFPKWYFDGEKCSQFVYGGCDGNDNQFDTEVECKRVCRQLTAICCQPKKTGPCKAAFNRWYYDGKKCSRFIYGGCEGNDNNFQSESECRKKCPA